MHIAGLLSLQTLPQFLGSSPQGILGKLSEINMTNLLMPMPKHFVAHITLAFPLLDSSSFFSRSVSLGVPWTYVTMI